MSFRYTVYRTQDESSDFLRRCFKRKAKDDYAEARELRRLLNDHFYIVLMRTPYSDLDAEKKGTVDMDAFTQAFWGVASPQELMLVFRLIDDDKSGTVTYGKWQSFHKKYDPEHRRSGSQRNNSRRKEGSPEFLEYGSMLDGILMSCSRFPLMAKLQECNEPFPPTVQWLTAAMESEWGNPKLRPHWVYATSPVPDTEEGRRFPDWNGGFTVRDEGHVGMTNEDFCRTEMATAAGLTMPEVVGLRLYTGPGYEALNLSLRANSQRFPVTQYCIDSAIGKMAHVAPQQPLLRGMRKPMDPRWVRLYNIYRGVGHKRLALSDPGFVSATTDMDVATGTDFGGPVLFALHTAAPTPLPHCGFLGNGGDVQWVSQYPSEAEILLPSNVILVPKLRCRHTRKRGHGLPLPPEKRVFEFLVFYPWDFHHHCPLVTADFLTCANALLDHVHGLDAAVVQQCKARHPTGVPTLTLSVPRPPAPPPPPSLDTLPSPAPFCPGQADPLDDRPFQFLDPAFKSLCGPLGLSPAHSSRDPPLAESTLSFAETIDDQLHVPAPLLLYRTALSLHLQFPSDGPPPPPYQTEVAISPHHSLSLPLSFSGLSLPNPCVCSSCARTHSTTTSDTSPACSFFDPESASTGRDPLSPTSSRASSAAGDVLSGTDALRLATVRHFTQAEVDAALERLRNRPVYDDGLDEAGLVGIDFPHVASVLLPFESSIWNVGTWGLVAGGVSAGLATLGLSCCAALGIAAGVTTTVVVASAVPVTLLHGRGAAVVPVNVTATATVTSTTTVTASHSRTHSPTATASGTASAVQARSATPTETTTLTRTTTRTPSGTGTATASASRTLSGTRTVTDTPTRTGTPSSSGTVTKMRTHSTTPSPTATPTRTRTLTSSGTATATRTMSETPSATSSRSRTLTRTASATSSATDSTLRTVSITRTSTDTATRTKSNTPSGTGTATASASRTLTGTRTVTDTPTRTGTPSSSGTVTKMRTHSTTPSPTATPTRTRTLTSSGTATATRTMSETPSATSSRSRTLTRTASATSSATHSTTRTVSITRTSTDTATRTTSNTPSATSSATCSTTRTISATRTATDSATQTKTITPSATASPSRTLSATVSGTATRTRTPTRTSSMTSSATRSPTRTRSGTSSGTDTPTTTATLSLSGTITSSATTTRTRSATETRTRSQTRTSSTTATATVSVTRTGSVSRTPTTTPTRTQTFTSSATASRTRTGTTTLTATTTPSSTPTHTFSATASASLSATLTQSATRSVTDTPTRTTTRTPSATASASLSPTQTQSATPSVTDTATRTTTGTSTVTFSGTPTGTLTRTMSLSGTATPTRTRTQTPSGTLSRTTTCTPSSTPQGTAVLSASVAIFVGPSVTLDVQFTSRHNYTAGASAVVDVGVVLAAFMLSSTSVSSYGCSVNASTSGQHFNVTLVDMGHCNVPAGEKLEFYGSLVLAPSKPSTFNLTTTLDPVPYQGTATFTVQTTSS